MQPQEPPLAINPMPDQAVVVFMRPSNYGGNVMFSVIDGQRRFLGDLNGRQYFVTTFPPGEYRFVVHAENNDMMRAQLTAGRVYYVLVAVRMGVWSARASISGLTPNREEWVNLQPWIESSTQMESDMASGQAAMNAAEIGEWITEAELSFANISDDERALRIVGPTDGVGPGPPAPPELPSPPAEPAEQAPPDETMAPVDEGAAPPPAESGGEL